jgi:hypothetical protein
MTKSATREAADKATFTQAEVTAKDTAARAGRKNLIINGGFDVWQRGTSLTAAASYLADRWRNSNSEAQSRQTFTAGQTDVSGFPTYYHRSGGGSATFYGLEQLIENVGMLGGREVTLSYWMKGSSAFTNAPYRVQGFGSGGSSEVEAALATHGVTTSWAKYTQTFTFPSITGKTVGVGSYSKVIVFRANIANIVVDLANVQLELGSVATDFEHRSYGEELALCARYYQEVYYGGTSSNAGYSHSFGPWLSLPVTMRANPTVARSIISGRNFYDYPGANVNSSNLVFHAVHVPGMTNTAVRAYYAGSADRLYLEGYITADAEL